MLSLLGGLGLSQTWLCPLWLRPQPQTASAPALHPVLPPQQLPLLCPGNPNTDLVTEDNSAPGCFVLLSPKQSQIPCPYLEAKDRGHVSHSQEV